MADRSTEDYLILDPNDSPEASTEDQENGVLAQKVKSLYPDRFEDGAKTMQCRLCAASIDLTANGSRRWRCDECETEFTVCDSCHEKRTEEAEHRSQHRGETFLHLETAHRWATKVKLERSSSCCSQMIASCLEVYGPRKFLGWFPVAGDLEHLSWITFEEARTQALSVVHFLTSLGVSEGARVGICSENRPESAIVDLTCLLARLVSVPLHTTLPDRDLEHVASSSSLSVIFVSEKLLPKLLGCLSSSAASLRALVVLGSERLVALDISQIAHVPLFTWDQLLREQQGKNTTDLSGFKASKGKPTDVVTIMHTSGSTGYPKGAVFDDRTWLSHLQHLITLRSIVLCGYMPLSHIAGRVDLYTAMFNGGRIAFPPQSESASQLLQVVQRIRPTAFGPVPRICQAIRELYLAERARGVSKEEARSALRNVLGGRLSSTKVTSAPVTDKMRRFLRKTLGISVSEGYGTTEVGSITMNGRLSTVVKLVSVPQLGYLVTDKPPKGEILVPKGKMRSSGYLQGAKQDGEWFATGDIGEWSNGLLRVVDRKDSVVKLSTGEFIALGKLEEAFVSSKNISRVLVYADSMKPGYVVVVVTRPEVEISMAKLVAELQAIASSRGVSPPCGVFWDKDFDGTWPITDSGKPLRRELVAKYRLKIDNMYIKAAVRRALCPAGGSGGDIDESSMSFVDLGGDSMAAVRLASTLKDQSISIPVDLLLSSTPVEKIAAFAKQRATLMPGTTPDRVDISEDIKVLRGKIQTLAPELPPQPASKITSVLVTGATGHLGQSLLTELLEHSGPETLFLCLIRKRSMENLPDSPRVIPILGDLSLPSLGLSESDLQRVRTEVSVVVHAAACVNHLVPYEDLHSTNVKSFIELASIVSPTAQFHVVTSSAVYSAETHRSNESGYSTSKWALDSLAQELGKLGRRTLIYRPSLIGGDTKTGRVNIRDWLQRLIRAVLDYKIIPEEMAKEEDSADTLNMVSADYCASVIAAGVLGTYTVPSGTVVDIGGPNLGVGRQLAIIGKSIGARALPFKEWFACLAEEAKRDDHPVEPFLSRFERGLPSWRKSMPPMNCDSIRPFSPMTREQVLKCTEWLSQQRR